MAFDCQVAGNSLTGAVPATIGKLPKIDGLNLQDNKLVRGAAWSRTCSQILILPAASAQCARRGVATGLEPNAVDCIAVTGHRHRAHVVELAILCSLL